ncbi:hypothetical protein DFH07DRAFT_928399 [Mycena maculata]|uniref:F-box domain-containing protein n=1 Tax=Mycena maculata TaxID=230809 RepID=A0AAD7I459_9AGAR|nr:hypothetical protein DFH07DRAFT_928399 [Mycena maculata]
MQVAASESDASASLGLYCPVLDLPTEIVCEIFAHFLPVYPDRPPALGLRSPTVLSHICYKWREIALSTPTLWRAIALSDSRRQTKAQWLNVLEAFLKRSGSYPLSIHLAIEDILEADRQMAPLFRAIASHCARWEHLELLYYDATLLRSVEGPLPLLRTLKLVPHRYSYEAPSTGNTFHSAPMLTSVSLQSYLPAEVPMIPWVQLTRLTINFINPFECAPLLNQTTSLVYLKLGLYWIGDVANINPLPSLRTLILRDESSRLGVAGGFLSTLILTGLRQLQIPARSLTVEHLRTFLWNSRCTLEELCIISADLYSPSDLYSKAFPSLASVLFDRELDGIQEDFPEDVGEDTESDAEADGDQGEGGGLLFGMPFDELDFEGDSDGEG